MSLHSQQFIEGKRVQRVAVLWRSKPMAQEILYCSNHKDIETTLRCAKCDKPICGKCVVFTDVDTRCRECARLQRIPTYNVSPIYLVRGLVGGLAIGVAAGFTLALLLTVGLPGQLGRVAGIVGPLAIIAIGYTVGETVTLVTNKKRGPALQAVGVASLVVGYLVLEALTPWLIIGSLFGIIAAIVAIAIVVGRLQ